MLERNIEDNFGSEDINKRPDTQQSGQENLQHVIVKSDIGKPPMTLIHRPIQSPIVKLPLSEDLRQVNTPRQDSYDDENRNTIKQINKGELDLNNNDGITNLPQETERPNHNLPPGSFGIGAENILEEEKK